MADRYSFQSPFSRGSSDDPWFMAGTIAVNTTTFITGLGLIGVALTLVSTSAVNALVLTRSALTGGQVWRFVTYPIVSGNDFFWVLLGLIFFYMIGSQFERLLGRQAFTAMVASLIVIPAVLGVGVAVLTNTNIIGIGLSLPFLGLATGFAAANPQARSFFNIPFWAVIGFFFVVQVLTAISLPSLPLLVMLFSTGALGMVITRSLGFSNVEWIPSVPLPGFFSGQSATSSPQNTKKRSGRRNKKGASHLKSVPAPVSRASEDEIDALLDQVSEHGMGSLSKQQKQTLEHHAKEMRKRRDG